MDLGREGSRAVAMLSLGRTASSGHGSGRRGGGLGWHFVFRRFWLEVESVEQELDQRFVVVAVAFDFEGGVFLGEALEVGGGDLQTVEDSGAGFVIQRALQESAKDDLNGDLKRVGVLDDGHHEGMGGGVEVEVEVAVVVIAQGWGLAGGSVGLGVAAARSVIELGNGHGHPYGGVLQRKGVDAGIPGRRVTGVALLRLIGRAGCGNYLLS